MITKSINQFVVKAGIAKSICNFPKTLICDEFPLEGFESNIIYIRGEKRHLYTVGFLCPCNKSHKVFLNLQNDEHPYWVVKFHLNGTVTINPSIWFKRDCFSHFFIRRGKVIYVK